MFDIEKNKTDRTGFEEGKWFDFQEGVQVKIAATRSKRAAALYAKLGRDKNLKEMQDEKEMEKIVIQVYAEAIIVDWKGFVKNGKPLPCTPENVKYVLENSLEFYQFVTAVTNDVKNFRVEKVEAEKKSSKNS